MRRIVTSLLLAGLLAACAPRQSARQTSGVDPLMERYEEVAGEIDAVVARDGATEGIAFLRTTVDREPPLADICHALSHEIGEAAFVRHGLRDALRFEDDLCGSGYLHGVVESFLADVDDLASSLATVCEPNAANCYHGVGHGLMDRSKNDIPGSLELCHRFGQGFQRIQCAEGVFMENFDADLTSHPTQYLQPDDPFFPCRDRSTVDEGVCALYVPRYYLRLHPRDYDGAFAYCATQVPAGPRDACIKGVGDAAMKQNIQDPRFVEDLCDRASEGKTGYCIEGMTSYFIVHTASSAQGRALCGTLKEEHRVSCLKIVRESARFYPD